MNDGNSGDLAKRMSSKLERFANFGWFVMFVFLIVGSCLPAQRETAVTGLIVASLMWVLSQVLKAGIISSFQFLSGDDKPENSDKGSNEQP